MTVLTETLHAGGFIVSEANGMRSREQVAIGLSQTLVTAQVLGRAPVAASVTSSVAADAGNTGNGVFTIDATTPVLSDAKNGVYRVFCVEPVTNLGTFAVVDPKGVEIGRAIVGTTFSNQIKFAIADGATDFVAGDAFSVTVGIEDADYDYKTFDTTATDGCQHAAAVLFSAVTTDGSAKKQGVVMRRDCELRASDLTWPASNLTAAQKAQAIQELADLGIILR
ncbi:head decoration protein [Bradyrhizobium liaoningense]|uniref:head decoration protein n=1 Tax=Bradyrhizobium liaoningense TaxID=43992 RepID=UPI001BAA34EA|nr:head decoration protein [Bradyrhizobium liaoningense]MBR0855481.1 head decoration protein [Bradyrhizobium liaoningense]